MGVPFRCRCSFPVLAGGAHRRGAAAVSVLATAVLLLVQLAGPFATYAVDAGPGAALIERGSAQGASRSAAIWKDVDGNPLPFQSDEEIMEFLQTAQIESTADLAVGITRPRRVVLLKDGVRMHAALRDFDRQYERVRFNRLFFWQIRDSYLFDVAAYELSRMLGLNNVPPVVLRRVNGVGASLQVWVEDTLVESDRVDQKLEPPEAESVPFRRQYQMVRIFDTLIGNVDRNTGNILFDENWNFWLIDHSRSLVPDDTSLPYLGAIESCEKTVFERLKSLDRDELIERLSPPLTPADIGWILKRRDKIVERLENLIAERGAAAVIFDAIRDES